jgi:DNA-binding NtrC family response regulator
VVNCPRVLVIDDDTKVLKSISHALTAERLHVETAPSGVSGMRLLDERPFDAVICDLRMPDVDGLQVLDFSRSLPEAPIFIVLTAYGSVQLAVDACHRGADDFVEKPLHDLGLLARRVRELLDERRGGRFGTPPKLIGGPWLEATLERIWQVAAADDPVLIWGEVGTGKRLMANELWRSSSRAAGAFALVNCGALGKRPTSEAPWRTPRYSGGVLVLDEVGELPDDSQCNLVESLRQLEAGMDVAPPPQLVALSSLDLWEAVKQRRFRASLFFALSRHTLRMPPLRERREDIPALVDYFCQRLSQPDNGRVFGFTKPALERLCRQDWLGNVRELESFVERVCLAHGRRSDLTLADVLDELGHSPAQSSPAASPSLQLDELDGLAPGGSLAEAVRLYETTLIERALERAEGNQSEAARLLNTRRSTLSTKIRRHRERDWSDDNRH